MIRDVAIIIPTKDRLDWCILRTRFHVASKFSGCLLFVDSSTIDPSEEFQKHILQMGAKNVIFIHIPELGIHKAIEYSLRYLQHKCKYVVISGDDDFHVPKGLNECSIFLDENPEYFSVCGSAIISRIGIKEARGEVITSSTYWKKFEISEKEVLDRLNNIVQNYHNLEFALKRINKYLEIVTQVVSEFPSTDFSESTTLEYASSLSIAIEGRTGWVNTLFLIRGDHLMRPNSFATKNQNMLDWKNSILVRNQRVGLFLKKHFKDELRGFSLSDLILTLNLPLNEHFNFESFARKPQWAHFQFLRIKRRIRSIYLGIKYRQFLNWIK